MLCNSACVVIERDFASPFPIFEKTFETINHFTNKNMRTPPPLKIFFPPFPVGGSRPERSCHAERTVFGRAGVANSYGKAKLSADFKNFGRIVHGNMYIVDDFAKN